MYISPNSVRYKVIITNNQQEVEHIGSYRKKVKAYTDFNKIKKENDNVKFPLKFINTKKIKEAKYEILLLEIIESKDIEDIYLPNELGKYVKHVISNNDEWRIIDKSPLLKEETFWFYGFHPRYQRKDATFIINYIDKKKYKEFFIYKNKIIIRYENDIDLIICKCHEDAVRLLIYVSDYIKPNKNNIYFFNLTPKTKNTLINEISKKTGWNSTKIWRNSTRP